MSGEFMRRLVSFDAYSKASDGIQVKTKTGALVTIVSAVIIVYLFFSQVAAYFTINTQHHLLVDQGRQENLDVGLGVLFHKVKCADLSLTIGDARGQPYAGSDQKVKFVPHVSPEQRARDPHINIHDPNADGCTVLGTVTIRKMAGVIAFRSKTQMHRFPPGFWPTGAMLGAPKNFSHTIKVLQFGPALPSINGPLDDVTKGEKEGAGQYQYFLKVVPTMYERLLGGVIHSNQYSVTEFVTSADPKDPKTAGLPSEVVFKIDFSPIMVRITETHLSLLQFLTGLCAIVGGVFTVAGMVDSTVYQSAKILKKTL